MVDFPYEFFFKGKYITGQVRNINNKSSFEPSSNVMSYDIIEFFLKIHHKLVRKWHLGTGVMSVG